MRYEDFLTSKRQLGGEFGFDPTFIPDCLFDFQKFFLEWSLRKGRSAVFADCGLGKTLVELAWAKNVFERTRKPVLIIAPLAVSAQTVDEGAKFNIQAAISREGLVAHDITVTNYERLHYFKSGDFSGVVCDESSAIKSFDGKRRALVTEFLRLIPYRLLCTATAAPNDYVELGTSSEALGYLGYVDMLTRFFKNDQNTIKGVRTWTGQGKWRFKGHAEEPFWRFVCSWARAMRKPSDLGFDDSKFQLPPLMEQEHLVKARTLPEGYLFESQPRNLQEEREEQRRTLTERCEKVAELSSTKKPVIAWCHLNAEGDLLEKLIPDAVQIKGSDSPEHKEEALIAFGKGQIRALVTKPKITAWGLNWQHCAHMAFFPSHSYEQYYQGVRRCWRFGQVNPVQVDIITTESGHDVMKNLKRKANQADRMFTALVANMNEAMSIAQSNGFHKQTEIPKWLSNSK